MKPTADTPVFMLLHQLLHLSGYQAARKMERLGMKPGQAGILMILKCEGRLSQKELAKKMGITPPSMTVALRKLEAMGYILRKADPADQRIIRIELSDRGKECTEELKNIMQEMEELLYQGISYEERLFMKRLFLEMRKNLMSAAEFRGLDINTAMERAHPPIKKDMLEEKGDF